MGVDLMILPYDPCDWFSHNVLSCERRRELWPDIQKIEDTHGFDVPETFNSYLGRADSKNEDTHYGLTLETPYGEDLKWVKAVHLKQLSSHPAVTDNFINRAIWAYLEKLPDDWNCALYWH